MTRRKNSLIVQIIFKCIKFAAFVLYRFKTGEKIAEGHMPPSDQVNEKKIIDNSK